MEDAVREGRLGDGLLPVLEDDERPRLETADEDGRPLGQGEGDETRTGWASGVSCEKCGVETRLASSTGRAFCRLSGVE